MYNNCPTATRIIAFDAAHRVMNHESKCATLHGHRYTVELTAQAAELDEIGRVIDFSVLKGVVGKWLDDNWDHTSIIYDQDVEVLEALQKLPQKKPPAIVPFNPTAENMAEYILNVVGPELLGDKGVHLVKVRVWETPNCYAEAHL